MTLRGDMQLEMKSKLKHGKFHSVLADVGNMIRNSHNLPTTKVQGSYSKTSDIDQVNPGDSFRLGSGRSGLSLWGVVLTANWLEYRAKLFPLQGTKLLGRMEMP